MIRNRKISVIGAEMSGQHGPGLDCGSEDTLRGRTVKNGSVINMVGRASAHTSVLWLGAKVESTLRFWKRRWGG